ncbi:putative phosphoglycerate mutase [Phaeomoniella chlamydospora]|uniref:Putative phosphoglycerate mutase n=1 Tax=Phaeomoniella chlamydospora TaxID=158046 RepID=A0A0G2E582_PHACM|nr:putative phosphoglycerate mutase [Phaeomoniella chlamydospora]
MSAGLSQYSKKSGSISLGKSTAMRSVSLRLAQDGSPRLSAIPEPAEESSSNDTTANAFKMSDPPQNLRTAQLRIDAFLGEWLSPDYFEQITPPPSSVMMVAGAKADLLRPGEKIEGADLGNKSNGHFPGGWKGGFGDSSTVEESDSENREDLASTGHAVPSRSRASSTLASKDERPKPRISTNINSSGATYVPPTPTYAVSTSAPIPGGYVAHARDACVDVDYRWDSMRQPMEWGNGGEYGEEWSSMHKRFRNGLHKMIQWYKGEEANDNDDDDDAEVDTVIILVTHGAGCNALIGALTNQPVLLDVGMASLTMAVRKGTADQSDSQRLPRSRSPRHSRRSSLIESNISEEYDIKIMASTDHLRNGSTPLSPAVTPSPRSSSTPWKRTFGSTSSTDWSLDDSRPSTSQSVQRSSSIALRSHAATTTAATIKQQSGLWGSQAVADATTSESDSEMPNFGNATANPSDTFAAEAIKKAEMTNGEPKIATHHLPVRTASQRGLWGSPAINSKDSQAKRRWTVTEHNT